MKKLFASLCYILSFTVMHSQETGTPKTIEESFVVPFSAIEQVPIFPGCEEVLKKEQRKCFQEQLQRHISENFKYPTEAQKEKIQGRVSIIFVIGVKGEIYSIKTKGPHAILEEEAERIISLLPKMTPGKNRGRAVRVPFAIPLTFKL